MLYYCYGDIHYRKTIGRTLLRLSFLRADQSVGAAQSIFHGGMRTAQDEGHDELSYNYISREQFIPRHWRGWLYRLESGRGDPLDGA